ncbi:membrane protease YdiL (CAAX protease family) [Novosphingobium hassiacum]|uniref:Membrane protease YdiL (CAAX protease family) n=1 Tax=Novosphingobium hassiacum TaxID=173676 RepID=A0A7W5ZUE8_9SPHN|nr:CPBP family glutamic-type intramembrane protease [Novosphingobium hassiacum]MBB3860151.1 membrane protease YdiL (CAAX protease family) [Novosphingobium hassiacum]
MTDPIAIPPAAPIPSNIRAVLTEPFAFWARPHLIEPTGLRAPGALRHWALLTVLQVAVLLCVVVPIMLAWKSAFDLAAPNAFDGMGPLALWGGAVLLGPVLEELFFRAWLAGRRRALWAMAATIAGLALFVALGRGNALAGGGILLATVVVAAGGWFWLRRRVDRPGWFVRAFAWLFYANALVFAAMHLANYPKITLLALPMVLPQLWTGLMLGFIRLRIGLIPAIMTHIVSNAVTLGIALTWG